MAEKLSADELGALRQSFVMLTRNLFVYAQEGGVFSASTEAEKTVTEACDTVLAELTDLIDRCADLINAEGEVPICGSFKEEYTFWTYRSQSSMLSLYLEELESRYREVCRFAEILSGQDHSTSEDVEKFLQDCRATFAAAIHIFNDFVKGICDKVEIEDEDPRLAHAGHDHGHH